MSKKTLASTFLSLALVGTALIFVPALYLRYRAAADPAGIIDGLLRLSWWWPLVFVVALLVYVGGSLGHFRGLFAVYLPLFLTLCAVSLLALGWANDGTIVVDHPPRKLSRAEQIRLERGEAVHPEADFSPIAGVAVWAHQNLPPHPFGRPPVRPGDL